MSDRLLDQLLELNRIGKTIARCDLLLRRIGWLRRFGVVGFFVGLGFLLIDWRVQVVIHLGVTGLCIYTYWLIVRVDRLLDSLP